MLSAIIPSETCQLLNVAMVVKWPRCVSIMNNLRSKSSRLRLVAIAIDKSESCYEYAKGMGIEVFEDYQALLSMDHVNLIMELTGDDEILSNLIARKKPHVGILDRQASVVLFDMASDVTLESPLTSTLMEASPDGVLVIDREYRIVNCNKSRFIPGSSDKNAILGRYCYEVMQRSSFPCEGLMKCPAQETRRTGKLARSVYEIEGADKVPQIRQVTAYPVFNLFGEVGQCVLSIRDMTKTVTDKIEERTQALKKDLARVVQEDRLTSLGRLVASVCHEINNPITSIVTFTKLVHSTIQKGKLSVEESTSMARFLDLSFREGMRCGSIVKNLLTFARPESMEAKTFDITEVVNTILLLTGHQLELAKVECNVDLPSEPLNAWGDYAQIQQCILNLIFNAIDAMPGGGAISIRGGPIEGEDAIWLSVLDTGNGIEAHHLPRIFEPFFSTKTDGKGVGLGLSMLYGIIREHNGDVEVESEPGYGTKFTIKLPSRAIDRKMSSAGQAFVVSSKPIRDNQS